MLKSKSHFPALQNENNGFHFLSSLGRAVMKGFWAVAGSFPRLEGCRRAEATGLEQGWKVPSRWTHASQGLVWGPAAVCSVHMAFSSAPHVALLLSRASSRACP